MKNFQLLIIATLTLFSFTSCVKQMDAVPANIPAVATVTPADKFSDIKANDNFNWSTSHKINFSFLGSTGEDFQLVLKVQDADGNVLFEKLQKGNEDYNDAFEIPAHCKTLSVSYGSTIKEFDCNATSISFINN